MLDIYCDKNSVAIRFPASFLIELIKTEDQNNQDKDFEYMIIDNVNYRELYPPKDPNDPDFNQLKRNMFSVTTKDSSYSHENEYRFVVNRRRINSEILGFELNLPKRDTLDFHIIAHPKMPEWKFELLQNLLEKFDLKTRLSKSSIPKTRLK